LGPKKGTEACHEPGAAAREKNVKWKTSKRADKQREEGDRERGFTDKLGQRDREGGRGEARSARKMRLTFPWGKKKSRGKAQM